MCGYVCVGFIEPKLKRKSLLEYTNLFSPNKYERMKIKRKIKKFELKKKVKKWKPIVMFAINKENLKKVL